MLASVLFMVCAGFSATAADPPTAPNPMANSFYSIEKADLLQSEPGKEISSDACIRTEGGYYRCFAPFERLFGVTLLGYSDESLWQRLRRVCGLGE